MKKLWCQAKIGGTVVTVGGAMVMTIYKGPIVELFWTKYMHLQDSSHANHTTSSKNSSSDKEFLKGSILLIFATLAWASLFVLQVCTHRETKLSSRFSFSLLYNIFPFVFTSKE